MKTSQKLQMYADECWEEPKHPAIGKILDKAVAEVKILEKKLEQWYEGAPANPEYSACYLFEFLHGDRFEIVRFTREGFVSLDDGGIVSDRPRRFCHLPYIPGI